MEYVLNETKFPVGVEWQGLFGDEDDDDEAYGHYSIIRISTFEKRWWDYNEVKDPQSGEKTFKKDEQLFFVVVPLDVSFPEKLQM